MEKQLNIPVKILKPQMKINLISKVIFYIIMSFFRSENLQSERTQRLIGWEENMESKQKLPILIAEKTGPHFALGDTCYSWSEDTAVYNPDGKEIIARDNEISLLRKEDAGKAYFGCHTDIIHSL